MLKRCPHCRQTMRENRFGVFFSPQRIMLLDIVRGSKGISQWELSHRMGISLNCVRSHVFQINEILASTDWRLTGGGGHGYRLERKPLEKHPLAKHCPAG